MPNHVYNEVTLIGVSKADAAEKVLNQKGEVDFEVLVPLPINFWAGSSGIQHEKAFPGTHLDAATKMWGTKWGPYGDPELTEVDGNAFITFKTAWDHPRGWVCALFNTFNCKIETCWLSEGGAAAQSESYDPSGDRFGGGPSWKQTEIQDGSAEHRRLHKALWGVEEFEDEDAD